MEESLQIEKPKVDAKGCGVVLLVVLASLWIIVLSGVDLFASWALEQTLFESSSGVADIRWVIHAVYAALVFIPTLILSLTVKTPRLKLIFRVWMISFNPGNTNHPLKNVVSYCPKRDCDPPDQFNDHAPDWFDCI